MTIYAAYGSNLDPEQMLQRAPHSPARGSGWLTGWRIGFGAEDRGFDGALVTVVPDPTGQVFVMLYDVAVADERPLDSWEGAELGLYKKLRVRVDTLEGQLLAWVYVLDGYEGGLPSARYVEIIADAADAAGAPDDYVEWIRKRPCR
jgi:gamma-glutamylcyclotransferase (GGCT)/AIG2-like uncharacterized protein YtfP